MGDKYEALRGKDASEYPFVLARDAQEILADRDALAADNARLREALRQLLVRRVDSGSSVADWWEKCEGCGCSWDYGKPERHAPGCLAAPKGDA